MRFTVRGGGIARVTDAYHWLLRMSWPLFMCLGLGSYLAITSTFAILYMLSPGSVGGAVTFLDHLSFSVQTLSTIGYGTMAPVNAWAHILVILEAFAGMVFVAVGTGVIFARFGRPTARVVFSNVMTIHPRDGVPHLHFRVSNERQNQLMAAHMEMHILVDEVTSEGHNLRRLLPLVLVRADTPIFSMSWTVMHRIDDLSPLRDCKDVDDFAGLVAGMIVVLTGTEEVFAQQVHARKYYQPDAVRYGERFVDIVHDDGDGGIRIDVDRLHDTIPIPVLPQDEL